MNTLFALVALYWRQLFRDRFALAATFILPIMVAYVMVDIYRSEDDGARPAPVGVLLEEDGPVGRDLLRRLDDGGVVDVRTYDERAALERAIRTRIVEAGVVVLEEVEVAGGEPGTVQLVGPPTATIPGGARTAVERATSETGAALLVGRAARPDADPATALEIGAEQLSGTPTAVAAEATDAGRNQVGEAAAWALLATTVLFVFTNTMAAGGTVAEARELGILARARSAGASSGALAGGMAASLASYAAFVAVLMMATGRVVFGVPWASWAATGLVLTLVALAAGGLGALVGTLLPSAETASTVGGPLGFLLAMVGGSLWPLEIVGPTLQRIGHLVPHAWALDALRATAVDGRGLSAVAVPLAVLAAMTVGLVAVGGLRLRRVAERP